MIGRKKNADSGNNRDSAVAGLIDQVQCGRTKDYISKRILPQLQWYSRRSRECKQSYYRWTATVILLSAMVPIASVFADGTLWGKAVIATLGAVITAIHSFLVLYNYKDLWQTYQNKHESLLHILYCYFTNAGSFTGDASQTEKDLTLINACEEALSYHVGGKSSADSPSAEN